MKFVVCTHSYLLLVTLNDSLGLKDVRVLDRGYYDGADVTRDGILIAAIRKTDPWSGTSPAEIIWYDEYGHAGLPDIDASDVLDPHQMTFDPHDRVLWCTSAGDNSIVLKATHDTDATKKFRFYADSGEDGDFNHINSICVTDNGDTYYVVLHNLGKQPSQIYKFRRYDTHLPLSGIIHLSHDGVHNIETDGENFYYNASDDGKVIRFNPDIAEQDPKNYQVDAVTLGEDWHPKGMALTDEYCVVGYSEHAVETPRRYISASGLAFISRASWELRALVPILLKGRTVGNVNEVRVFGPRGDTSESTGGEEEEGE
jgi:hypothetical protein